jgi:hypothetical protein
MITPALPPPCNYVHCSLPILSPWPPPPPSHAWHTHTGCVVVNTWSDKDVSRLLVKLDNFGLARVYPHPLEYGLGASSKQSPGQV